MNRLTPERLAEIEKAVAANRAAKDALAKEQVEGQAEIKIRLVGSSDDPPLFSPETQADIQGVRNALRNDGIDAAAPFMVVDSADAGGGYLGEFIIPLAQFGAPAIAVIVGAWLRGRFGRKVRVEFFADGRLKRVDAQTTEQVTSVIEAARRKAQPRPKKQAK